MADPTPDVSALFSPQAGNTGLPLAPPPQGLPLPGGSSVQVPPNSRGTGPAPIPSLPQTPQPDFATLARAVQQQQNLANNPLYAMGQGFQGQNAQAPVMQQQMQLAQMIQQQRQSAIQEQQFYQQSLDRHIDMMMKIRQGIETGMLPEEFADTVGPMLEQQHNQLFGDGGPAAGQALPAAPGSITAMLKTGSSGGVTLQNAIDANQDATPADMQAALLLAKRDPKDGLEKAQKYLDARRKARLAAIEPTMTDHLTQLVNGLQQQMGGGTPTLQQVTQAAQQELDSHSDQEVAGAYGGESKAFLKKALTTALQADSPFIKGLNVQVGAGTVAGAGASSQFIDTAIQELSRSHPELANITSTNGFAQQPAGIQRIIRDRAATLEEQSRGKVAYQTGLGAALAKQDEPIYQGLQKGQIVLNRKTGMPVDVFQTPKQIGLNAKDHVIVDQQDADKITGTNTLLTQLGALSDVVKAQADTPGANLAQSIVQWGQTKMGIYNPGEAIRQYGLLRDQMIRAMQGAGGRAFGPQQIALVSNMLPTAEVLNSTSASQGLQRLSRTADIFMTYRDGLLHNVDPQAAVDKIGAAIKDMGDEQAQTAKRLGGRVITDGTQTAVLPAGQAMPKGWRDK